MMEQKNSEVQLDFFLDDTKLSDAVNKISSIRELPRRNKFIISFCGIFSSGKSSLINLILSNQVRLPKGICPVTNIITQIEYEAIFSAYAMCENNTFLLNDAEVEKTITQGKIKGELCSKVLIKAPVLLLKNDIVIQDTPGYCENEKNDEATDLAVSDSDFVVFCCHAQTAGRQFERDYISVLDRSVGDFCLVINQIDGIGEGDIDILKDDIRELFACNKRSVLQDADVKKLFFTSARENAPSLDGLDSFIFWLCSDEGYCWRDKIMEQALCKKKLSLYDKLGREVSKFIALGEDLYNQMKLKLENQQYENHQEFILQREKTEDIIKGLRFQGKKISHEALSSIELALEVRVERGMWTEAEKNIKKLIIDIFGEIPKYYSEWQQQNICDVNRNGQCIYLDFNELFKDVILPTVNDSLLQSDNLIQQAFSRVGSSIGLSTAEEKRIMASREYATKVKGYVYSSILPRIENEINTYLEEVNILIQPIEKPVDFTVLRDIQDRIALWRELHDKININKNYYEQIITSNGGR